MTTCQELSAGPLWIGYGLPFPIAVEIPPVAINCSAQGSRQVVLSAVPLLGAYRAVGCSGIPANARCIAANSGLISACHCGVSHGGQLHV